LLRVNIQVHEKSFCLSEFEMKGHAGINPAGTNLVCAAASHLSRSTAALLKSRLKDSVEIISLGRGHIKVRIKDSTSVNPEWLKGVSDLFVSGIQDLQKEAPDVLEIESVIVR